MEIILKTVALGALCASAVACTGGGASPTSPSGNPSLSGLAAPADSGARTSGQAVASASTARGGSLVVTKECSEDTGLAGSFCTITASNLKTIDVGSRIVYSKAGGATSLDSDIVLDPPGPGNNSAFGHCTLLFATGTGVCTFSGGTGKFTWFHARVDVSYLGGPDWGWDGSYDFSPRD